MAEKAECDFGASEAQRILERKCNTWPKILNFHFGNVHQKLKVYRNTPDNQVLFTITKIFKKELPEAAVLQASLNLLLLDEEGIPIVFNVEAIPIDLKLYLHFNEIKEEAIAIAKEKKVSDEDSWHWDEGFNELYCGYTIKNRVEVSNQAGNDLKGGMPVLLSSKKFKLESGVYRFKIIVDGPGVLYTQVGIVYESESKNIEALSNCNENMKSLGSFQKFTVMGESENEFVLDTINRELKIGKLVWKGVNEACYVGVAIRRGAEARIRVLFD